MGRIMRSNEDKLFLVRRMRARHAYGTCMRACASGGLRKTRDVACTCRNENNGRPVILSSISSANTPRDKIVLHVCVIADIIACSGSRGARDTAMLLRATGPVAAEDPTWQRCRATSRIPDARGGKSVASAKFLRQRNRISRARRHPDVAPAATVINILSCKCWLAATLLYRRLLYRRVASFTIGITTS